MPRRSIRRHVSLGVLLAVVASPWSCATVSKHVVLQPEEFSCENDSDCQIVASDVTGAGCCGGAPEEPYAISKVTVRRQAAINRARCGGTVCTAIMHTCCCTKSSEWVAVCASAFILPQGRGQLASTAICGLLVTVTAALTSYDHRFRYLTEGLGLLVVVLAFVAHPLGGATFWHNGIMGISTMAAAFADRGPLAERYERDLFVG